MSKGEMASAFVLLAIIAAVLWVTVGVWEECRDDGHSFFYCLKLVSR
jgi:hypothetical protein